MTNYNTNYPTIEKFKDSGGTNKGLKLLNKFTNKGYVCDKLKTTLGNEISSLLEQHSNILLEYKTQSSLAEYSFQNIKDYTQSLDYNLCMNPAFKESVVALESETNNFISLIEQGTLTKPVECSGTCNAEEGTTHEAGASA